MKYFWDSWENKTKIEKAAIAAAKTAKSIILKSIPRNELLAIYVKGSLVRRELNAKSDVDIVTILKTNKYKAKMDEIDRNHQLKSSKMEFTSFSMWELKNNKHFINNRVRAKPDLFVQKINHYKLIYGKKIKTTGFKRRTQTKILKDRIDAFNKYFIPLYKKGKFKFSELIKQVFWLVEINEKKIFKSWEEINRAIKDKANIIHEAYKFRLKAPKSKRIMDNFVKKIEVYLSELR